MNPFPDPASAAPRRVAFRLGLALLILALLAWTCWHFLGNHPSTITVFNDSGQTLSNLAVTGAGFSNHTALLPSGSAWRIVPEIRGDSSLGIAFDAAGSQIQSNLDSYFERINYRVTTSIHSNLNVSVSARTRF